jgi:hypothetical protein
MAYQPLPPVGQDDMAGSLPVVIASDQSAVPVSGTVTANIGTVATLATAAKQDTGNASVASIDTKTPALGQALAAASVPVVLTAAQITTLTPPAAITGFATAANQLPDGHNVTVDNASLTVTATDLDIRALVNTDVVTAELSAVDNAVLDTIDAVLDTIKVDTEAIETAVEAIQAAQLPDGHNVTIDNASIAVTGTVDLGATDNAVLDAIAASVAAIDTDTTTVIGHLDGVEALLATIDADTSNLSVVGGGTEAAAIRVTIANNSTGVLSIDDNGSSLTVDGSISLIPTTSGGADTFRSLDLDETEEEVKASAGQVYGYYYYNAAATVRYLKFYNATAANVTVGSTAPVRTYPLPPTTAAHIAIPYGLAFSTAITVAATTGLADADTGAPAANDVIVNIDYK